jgi:hypothetical protein
MLGRSRAASIASDDALILPHRANPRGWDFGGQALEHLARGIQASLVGSLNE